MAKPEAIFKIIGPDLDRDQVMVPASGLQIGRVRGNDLVLDNARISRNHVRFAWREGHLFIEDLDSRNGTWVGEDRLAPNALRQLQPGDAVRIGPYVLILERLADGPAAPPPPPILPEEALVAPQDGGSGPEAGANGGMASQPPPLPPLERAEFSRNGGYTPGIPRDESSWLQYLPAIYSDTKLPENDFIGRYLLIFESIMTPLTWAIDNFDQFLSVEITPSEWLAWFGEWFDLLLIPHLPLDRQRLVLRELGWLFLRRGTRRGLERLLELYFDVQPQITESTDQACHFAVTLPLSQSPVKIEQDLIERLIDSQKPAFTAYTLTLT